MNQGKRIAIYWVKAHADVRENERAEELAKQAATKLKVRPHYDKCPVSFVKRQIRMETVDKWNRRTGPNVSEQTASITKLFFPDVSKTYKAMKEIGITSLHTQILTGHGGFSEYLYRFKCKDDPSCPCEPGRPQTVPHVVFDCPVYGRERYRVSQQIGIDVAVENINELTMKKHLSEFVRFCCKISE